MPKKYTYFVVTPGVEINSYITYKSGAKGNYFKFGDTDETSDIGVRKGYTSHNPDIGIFAVLMNGLDDSLGRKITGSIKEKTEQATVPGTTEWFSFKAPSVWKLAELLKTKYDRKTITDDNYDQFIDEVVKCIT